jgi:hypothetical protein
LATKIARKALLPEFDVVRRCVAPIGGFAHVTCKPRAYGSPSRFLAAPRGFFCSDERGGIVVHKRGATTQTFASADKLFELWSETKCPTAAYWLVHNFVGDVARIVLNDTKRPASFSLDQEPAASAKRPKVGAGGTSWEDAIVLE